MSERTLRERIIKQREDGTLMTPDQRLAWDAAFRRVLSVIDAHTAAQPAPDTVAEALEAAASIADEYAAENFRMATDSVVLDRAQRFSDTEERQIEGNGHSSAGITARNIAAAIRALADKDTA